MSLALAVAACEQGEADMANWAGDAASADGTEEYAATPVVDLLAAGDGRACADADVRASVHEILASQNSSYYLRARWPDADVQAFNQQIEVGVDTVTALMVDPSIHAVGCSATYSVSYGERNVRQQIVYQVQTELDTGGPIVHVEDVLVAARPFYAASLEYYRANIKGQREVNRSPFDL
jgi:hypothetical protein